MDGAHSQFVFGVKIPFRSLQHFFDHVHVVGRNRTMQQILLPVLASFDGRWLLLYEILQLHTQIRVGGSVKLDQLVQSVVNRHLPVYRKKRVLAVLVDLVVPEHILVIN